MKHNLKVTAILITMFVLTQLIGLFVISVYQNPSNSLPFGMQPPADIPQNTSIFSILFAFVIAIFLFFILTKINAEKFIRGWFFIVTGIAIGLTLKALYLWKLKDLSFVNNIPILNQIAPEVSIFSLIVFLIGLTLAYIKIFKRNIIVHNVTELMIYPGIAAVFIPLLNVYGIIFLLLAISIYDMWAVWKSEFMQKMATYQIKNLKFFTGFFIPYANKEEKLKMKNIKDKYKNKTEEFLSKQFEKAKVKVNLAILGGGDVIFPIITAGVFFKLFGIIPALIITVFATLSLLGLFMLAQKGKFYPAMPFLTIGMYAGMVVDWLLLSLKVI